MNASHRSATLALAATALAVGTALAVPAPRPLASANPASSIATSAVAARVERGADHVTADELTRWLADPNRATVLVDVREAADYDAWHLPGAVRLDVVDLLGARGEELFASRPGATFVLYSNGMTHPAQAWFELARRGRTDVLVLEDGLEGWIDHVLLPASLRGDAQDPAPRAAAPAQAQAPIRKERWATDPQDLTTPTFVSAAWLAAHANDVVVVDTREKADDYAAGHVPGARHVPTGALRETRDGVPDELLGRDALAKKIGALGIGADTRVVAYGGEKLQDPTHFALALVTLGHERVAVLEGGIAAWKADGRAVTADVPTLVARTYEPRGPSGVTQVDLAGVRDASTRGDVRILDVRPADAFRGDVSTEARAGHIPGSTNRPYTLDVDVGAAGTYGKSLEDLRRDFAALGLGAKTPVVVTCRTGHQASQTWFLLRYGLGYEDVRWYDGSWKEWAAHPELPAETGPGKDVTR